MYRYLVISPQYTYTEPVLEDGSGPSFDVRDVALVDAPNANKARWLAVQRVWTRRDQWPAETRHDKTHPLAGIEAIKTEESDSEWSKQDTYLWPYDD